MKNQETKTRNQILTVLFIGVLMGALDIAIVGPALPAIKESFAGVTDRAMAWIFTIYVLFNLVGTPLMAKLSDIFGRRSVYTADVALFAVGSLVVALAPSFTFVLIGRGIQGLGAGGIFPVASAVIGDTFPPEKRGSALGLIGAVFGLAFIIGPILGGVLLLAGWRWLFIINLPVAVLVIVLSQRTLPAQRRAPTGAFDWAGMALLGLGLASLTAGINQIDTAHFFSSLATVNVWAFLVVTAGLLVAFVSLERRAANPVVRLDFFKTRQMLLAFLLSAGAGMGEAGLVFMPALALAAGIAGSKSSASFLLMPVVLAMSVGSPTVGRLLDKFGSRVVILGGTLILILGFGVLGRLVSGVGTFILAGALVGLGLSALLGAPLRYIMLNEAAAADRSSAQGVLTLFGSVGQLFGASVVGAVAASSGGTALGYGNAYLVTGVVTLGLLAAAFGLKKQAMEMKVE